jgi:hypothetical protein
MLSTMIKVLFPKGCYGHYLTKCIYNYSNLREELFFLFAFDENGSSHDHRKNKISKTKIDCGHAHHLDILDGDIVISLLPDPNSSLDYYNNQFFKQDKGHLVNYLTNSFSADEISDNLKNNWGYYKDLDLTTPQWILREWCSFWITEAWKDDYNRDVYQQLGTLTFEVSNLLSNIIETLNFIFKHLQLEYSVSSDIIVATHQQFLSSQRFLKSQFNCQQLVNYVLFEESNVNTNVQTIFDEAYIQYLLRKSGYELCCDGLNTFPTTTFELKKIIYKI